jgi:hypothetical protein
MTGTSEETVLRIFAQFGAGVLYKKLSKMREFCNRRPEPVTLYRKAQIEAFRLSNFCGMWIKLFSGDNHTNQCS